MKLTRQDGMTLIELMIVTVLLGVLAVYAVVRLGAHSKNQAVDRTVVSMQYILEASKVYYLGNQNEQGTGKLTWPNSTQDLINSKSLPAGSECSPWPTATKTSNCGNTQAYTLQTAPDNSYILVKAKVPNGRIAKQIQQQLPSSYIEGSSTVVASVAKPGLGDRGWLVAGGIVSGGSDNRDSTIYMPNCPDGYEGHVILTPQDMITGWGAEPNEILRLIPLVNLPGPIINNLVNCEQVRSGLTRLTFGNAGVVDYKSDSPYVTARLELDPCSSQTSTDFITTYYLSFCIPNGNWSALDWEEDNANSSQCPRGGWENYNSGPGVRPCGT